MPKIIKIELSLTKDKNRIVQFFDSVCIFFSHSSYNDCALPTHHR